MSLPSIFISYNQNSEVEQTLAIRLHTIGAVHGYNMLLPERLSNAQTVSIESKYRIEQSDFFICFSTVTLTPIVQQEINIAFSKLHDRSKILVIYDERVGTNPTGAENCTAVFINTQDDPLKIVTAITKKLQTTSTKNESESILSTLGGVLLLGLGLFALADGLGAPAKKRPRIGRKDAVKRRATKKVKRKNV
jgi:hypothetical protein